MSECEGVLNENGRFYKWIVEKLSANKPDFANRLSSTTVAKITSEHIYKGVGLTSKIFRIVVHFNDDGKDDTVILKTPDRTGLDRINTAFKVDNAEKEDYTSLVYRLINRETQFFNLFGNCKKLKIPKIYAVELFNEDYSIGGTIMMEDLSKKAAVQSNEKPFSKNQILSLVDQFINCTALSLQTDRNIEKDFPRDSDLIDTFFTLVRKSIDKLKIDHPGVFDEQLLKIEKILGMREFQTYLQEDLNKQLGIPTVLAHSDIQPRNMLWKRNEDGSISDDLYALIDWQRVHFDDVGQDLAATLVICTTAEVRRDLEQWIFDYFCKRLLELMQKTNPSATIPFTAKTVKLSYQRSFIRFTFLLPSVRMILFDGDELKASENEFCRRLSAAYADSFQILKQNFSPFNSL